MHIEQVVRKIKPGLILAKVNLNSTEKYLQFLKRRPKILKKVKIERTCVTNGTFNADESQKMIQTLTRTFKAIKYARKLDLRKLELVSKPILRPKAIYFAKRMSHAKIVLIQDQKLRNTNFKGVTEPWAKYTKRAHRFSYFVTMNLTVEDFSKKELGLSPKSVGRFLNCLSYQRRLKDLTLSFARPPTNRSLWARKEFQEMQDLHLLQKCSKNLQRLSLQGINSDIPIIDTLHHLENLKHLDLQFDPLCKVTTMTSLLQLLPQISSHLQSLSLDWPTNFPNSVTSLQTLNCLTKLKIKSNIKDSFRYFKRGDALQILKSFSSCPINDLTLEVNHCSREHLFEIAKFLEKFPDLERLKLKLHCEYSFWGSEMKYTEQLLGIIEDLALIRNVSVSILIEPISKLSELPPIFSKIFTKPIRLESFKIAIPSIHASDKSFLQLLESLKPAVPNLKKLRIDIGDFTIEKKDPSTLFNFLQSLESIQVLRLDCLKIPNMKFFQDLLEIVFKIPNLRTFTIGKVSERIPKPKFMEIVDRILQKQGLKTFDCRVISKVQNILERKDDGYPEIDVDKIEKINPELKIFPAIDMFTWKNDEKWIVPKEN